MAAYTDPLFRYGRNLTDGTELDGLLPGTAENDVPTTASVTNNWTSVNNIKTDAENQFASLTSHTGPTYTFPYIRASNFAFDIPSGATIDGVEASVNWSTITQANYTDLNVYLAWGASASTLSTTNKGSGLAIAGGIDLYGGAADTWGSSLTDTIINSSDFGLIYRPQRTTGTGVRSIYPISIRLKVWYTDTPDGAQRVTQAEGMVLTTGPDEDVQVTQVYAEVLFKEPISYGYAPPCIIVT